MNINKKIQDLEKEIEEFKNKNNIMEGIIPTDDNEIFDYYIKKAKLETLKEVKKEIEKEIRENSGEILDNKPQYKAKVRLLKSLLEENDKI